MSSAVAFSWGEMVSLESLVASGEVKLGRGNVISKIDIQNNPGPYPIYSSSSKNDGKMGEYGDYMFDEEMISWSVDGGGYFFHRPKHKFSVTNVSGYMRLNSDWDYKFTAYSFQFQHGYFSFDYQTKAHPSVIREFYFLPKIPVAEQQKIATILSSVDDVIEKTRAQIDKLKDLKTGMMQELLTKGIGHTEFKDSAVGRIPVSWQITKVGEVSKVKRGASPRPIQDPKWWGGKVGWVRISDVTSSRKYLTKTTQYLSGAGVSKSVQIPKGEVVLSICATIGRPIIVKVDACIHDGFVWFEKLRDSIDREFWYYFLASKEELLSSQRQSGTQGNLNTSIVSELDLPLPPQHEQEKIAAIMASIDIKIEKMLTKLSKLENQKKALMQDLLTGKVRVNLTDKESAVV